MFKNISKGLQAYSGAFGLISKLKLWSYFAIPIALSIVVAIAIFGIAYGLSDNLGRFISKIWVWEWGKETFLTIGSFIGGLFILVIGLILYKNIIMALSAPFMSPVSEKIEAYLIGEEAVHQHRNTSFQQQLMRGLRINIRNLFRELFLSIVIIIGGLIIPFIGTAISTALLFIVQAYYAGFGNMDYTLERHFNYRESIQFVKRFRGVAIGNGIFFMLFLLIPVVGVIIVLPLSVTAASINTVELIKNNPKLIEFRVADIKPNEIENL
ncbi:MAG: EI24 domain-containing protein [Bacteroidota bacterium]